MRIEEYLATLPGNLMSGEDAKLPQSALEEALGLAGIGSGDVFYHIGCGGGKGIAAAMRMGAKKAVGIEINPEKARRARQEAKGTGAQVVCADALDADMSDATAVLFWFADENITHKMAGRFGELGPGARIITLWGPLPGCLPDEVRFPYMVSRTPLREARDMREQMGAVFGVDCIDFVTAWEFAERYTKAVGSGTANDRFLTIIQTLTIWINAKRMGLACGEGVPEPVRAYMRIMKEHFGIDFGHLLEG